MGTIDTMETLSGDILDINNAFGTYTEYKAAIDAELQRSAESFVRIGYLLKVARDTDILTESGYRSVNEFAEREYGLDKSQVSRFIRINDEFSEDGYSDRLQERYRAFGYSKLALMLMLPAAVNEELTADYTKTEINLIKAEIDEEKRRSDLEVMMEERDERQQEFNSFGKILYEIGRDSEMYLRLYDVVADRIDDGRINHVIDDLLDILAPAGENTMCMRISGEGRKMLIIKGPEMDPVLVDIRSGEKQTCTWSQLIEQIKVICCNGGTGREAWEYSYGSPFPEKEEGATPVRPKRQEENRATRVKVVKKPEETIQETSTDQEEKDAREQEAGEREDKEDPDTDHESFAAVEPADPADGTGAGTGETDPAAGTGCEESGVAPVQPEDEQLEGQMDITEFPQYMPETSADPVEVIPAGSSTTVDDAQEAIAEIGPLVSLDGMEMHIKNQTELINRDLFMMIKQCTDRDWDGLVEKAKGIITRAESLKRMLEVYEQ